MRIYTEQFQAKANPFKMEEPEKVASIDGVVSGLNRVSKGFRQLQDIDERNQRLQAAADSAELRSVYSQKITDLVNSGSDITPDLIKKMDVDFQNEVDKKKKDKGSEYQFMMDYNSIGVRQSITGSMENAYIDNQIQKTRSNVERLVANNTNAVLNNPLMLEDTIAATDENIMKNGIMSPDERVRQSKSMKQSMAYSVMETMLMNEPGQLANDIKAGRFKDFISPETQVRMLKSAERVVASGAGKAETDVDTYTNFDAKIQSGDFVASEVLADMRTAVRQGRMTLSDFRSLQGDVEKASNSLESYAVKQLRSESMFTAMDMREKENAAIVEWTDWRKQNKDADLYSVNSKISELKSKYDLGSSLKSISQAEKQRKDAFRLYYSDVDSSYKKPTVLGIRNSVKQIITRKDLTQRQKMELMQVFENEEQNLLQQEDLTNGK